MSESLPPHQGPTLYLRKRKNNQSDANKNILCLIGTSVNGTKKTRKQWTEYGSGCVIFADGMAEAGPLEKATCPQGSDQVSHGGIWGTVSAWTSSGIQVQGPMKCLKYPSEGVS